MSALTQTLWELLVELGLRLAIGVVLSNAVLVIYFTWDMTRRVNACCGNTDENPLEQMGLALLPFYFVYWAWRQAERLDEAARMRGLQLTAVSLPCLLLAALCPYLAVWMLEDRAAALDRAALAA